MPMKPEAKAKQKARQEAEWAKQKGEAIPPPISNDFVEPGCEQFSEPVAIGAESPADLGPYPEPEMPITPTPAPKKPAAKKAAAKKK